MEGDEKIGIFSVGHCSPVFKTHKAVVRTGQDDLNAKVLFQLHSQLLGDFQNNILFRHPIDSYGARVFSSVTGIEDDFLYPDYRGFGFFGGRYGGFASLYRERRRSRFTLLRGGRRWHYRLAWLNRRRGFV